MIQDKTSGIPPDACHFVGASLLATLGKRVASNRAPAGPNSTLPHAHWLKTILPLDTPAGVWRFTAVRRLLNIMSFLLLAVWLPATLHCDLEAAGLAKAHQASNAAESDCNTDLCANVESSLIRESAPTLNLAAPVACDCLLCIATFLTVGLEPESESSLSVVRHVPPREIEAGWQFLTRAAPPSRAPSVILA